MTNPLSKTRALPLSLVEGRWRDVEVETGQLRNELSQVGDRQEIAKAIVMKILASQRKGSNEEG